MTQIKKALRDFLCPSSKTGDLHRGTRSREFRGRPDPNPERGTSGFDNPEEYSGSNPSCRSSSGCNPEDKEKMEDHQSSPPSQKETI
mgnify:CR=1 FL=1